MVHTLKILKRFYDEIITGAKQFEIRKADRPYGIGDTLHLMEWSPYEDNYTGRAIKVEVTYISSEINEHIVMGIAKLPEGTQPDILNGCSAIMADYPVYQNEVRSYVEHRILKDHQFFNLLAHETTVNAIEKNIRDNGISDLDINDYFIDIRYEDKQPVLYKSLKSEQGNQKPMKNPPLELVFGLSINLPDNMSVNIPDNLYTGFINRSSTIQSILPLSEYNTLRST